MLAAFAQFGNDVRSDRTRAGMKAEILPPGAPGVMNVDRGDLARQLRRLGPAGQIAPR